MAQTLHQSDCVGPRVRPGRLALALGVILITQAACSTTALTNGQKLAQAGQAAAMQMDQNATISANTLVAVRKAVAFNDGFNHAIGNAGSARFVADATKIQSGLNQYGKLLESLSSSYSALGDLSSYDAVGAFDTSIDGLAKDTQSFASAVGHPVTIPASVTGGVKAVGGLAIQRAQAHKVKEASDKIEVVLKAIIAILDDPLTKAKLVPAREMMTGIVSQAATTLYNTGVYAYTPTLNDLGGPLGFTATADAEKVVAAQPSIRAGLDNVAVELASEQSANMEDSYDKSVAALKALVSLHDGLAKDAPLNLSTIRAAVSQLNSLAASLKAASAGTSSTSTGGK